MPSFTGAHGSLGAVLTRVLFGLLLLSACTPSTDPVSPRPRGDGPSASASFPDAESCEAGGSLRPIAAAQPSSSIVLARHDKGPLAGKLLAFVADEDGRAIATVDVDGKKPVASLALPVAASQMLLLPDGRLLATLRGADRLAVLRADETGSLSLVCTRPTAPEPVAVVATGSADTILVASGWGASLQAFDTRLEKKGEVSLPRDPRHVVLSDDEKTAFVSHAVGGKVSVVELAPLRALAPISLFEDPSKATDPEVAPLSLSSSVERAIGRGGALVAGENGVRIGINGSALVKSPALPGRLLLPQLLVDPGDPNARTDGYGSGTRMATPNIALIDTATRSLVPSSIPSGEMGLMLDGFEGRGISGVPESPGCLSPRGAVIDDASATLIVACLGAGTVVAYDAASASPVSVETARWDVGAGPTGVSVDAKGRRAIVWSQFERSVDILRLDQIGAVVAPADRPRRDKIDLAPLKDGPPLGYLLGRQIFYGVADIRISSMGVACATCHIDGRDDGLVWMTPDGPRRTASLAGRMDPPFGWSGASEDIESHLDVEFKRLRGQGLRSVQRDAVLAYLQSIPKPPPSKADKRELSEKGALVFNAKGCASCHPGGGTDGKAHDVGSRAQSDKTSKFDTPSLHHLAGRAPYFHDGRHQTVRDVLGQPHGEGDKKPHLERADVEAIEAYLLSL